MSDYDFLHVVRKTGRADVKVIVPADEVLNQLINTKVKPQVGLESFIKFFFLHYPHLTIENFNIPHIDQDIEPMTHWFKEILKAKDIKSKKALWFELDSEFCYESDDNDDGIEWTFAISLRGSETFDKQQAWYADSGYFSEQVFRSENLGYLYNLSRQAFLKPSLEQSVFIEKVIFYGYSVLLVHSVCKVIVSTNPLLSSKHIAVGFRDQNYFEGYDSFEFQISAHPPKKTKKNI